MFTSEDVGIVRHVVQRILVPCVFVIGLLGNSVSIYVLTRRRMRCTTNIYLTALAITDIIYLTMALLLSLQHYDYVKRYCEPYWMSYGIFVWLCDACAYISIYIAMCFTIERFIAIRYPLKRQTFCTESLAKRVIAGVALFCLLSTISTAFEHQYRSEYKLIDINTGKACSSNLTLGNVNAYQANQMTDKTELWQGSGYGSNSAQQEQLDLHSPLQQMGAFSKQRKRLSRNTRKVTTTIRDIPNKMGTVELEDDYTSEYLLDLEFLSTEAEVFSAHKQNKRQLSKDGLLDDKGQKDNYVLDTVDDIYDFNKTTFCQNTTFFKNGFSSLGENTLYTIIWYYFTLIVFVLVPLCVLVTFNFFLILLVRKSKSLRGDLTNANSIRKSRKERKSTTSTVSQENRVTVTLIAVVLLFIICQLPWAMYLIVVAHVRIDGNLQAILGNIFNFLAAINAAANFFLYCVLSDKYRKTIRELITGYKYRKSRNTLTNASLYTNATTNGSRRYRHTSSSVIIK